MPPGVRYSETQITARGPAPPPSTMNHQRQAQGKEVRPIVLSCRCDVTLSPLLWAGMPAQRRGRQREPMHGTLHTQFDDCFVCSLRDSFSSRCLCLAINSSMALIARFLSCLDVKVANFDEAQLTKGGQSAAKRADIPGAHILSHVL